VRGGWRRLDHVLIRPVILGYVAARVRSLRHVPIPRDSPHGHVPGPDPLRIAVIGDATAVGYGTVSQQLGVAAHFARELSRRDGRGVDWFTAQFRQLTMATAIEVVSDGARFQRVDKVVVIAGTRDAIALMPVATWARLLDDMLITLRSRLPVTARILVAEVPPLEFYSSIPPRLRRIISVHARELNGVTGKVVARHHGVCTVAIDQEHVIDLGQPADTGVSGLYLRWAQSLLAADGESGVPATGPVTDPARGAVPAAGLPDLLDREDDDGAD
jgi:hypothetical protein